MLPVLIALSITAKTLTTVEVVKYEQWNHCYRVSNGLVEFIVVPKIGRIMRFGPIGGRNLFWEAPRTSGHPPDSGGWANWGGDKVWPAPQSAWNWPPEREYDGAAWTATQIPDGVRLQTNAPSKKLGVSFVREITLSPGTRRVTSKITLVNRSSRPLKAAPWEICQVDNPEECLLPLHATQENPDGYIAYDKLGTTRLRRHGEGIVGYIARDRQQGLKYGSRSRLGTVSAWWKGTMLDLQTTVASQAEYADQGCPEQIYTSADPLKYCELELLGPLVTLQPGESTAMTLEIALRFFPAGSSPPGN